MSEEHFGKLQRMYKEAPCNLAYNPGISVQAGAAQVSLSVKPDMFHAAGSVHGSIYFKLLDDAAYFAAASYEESVFLTTATFNCYFLKPITNGALSAEGKVKNVSRQLFVAESVLMNTSGETIARGSGTFMRTKVALVPEMGYRL